MTSTTIYHYVYRITNLVENKHYYGKRSSKIEPKFDLGRKYFSSSKNKNFLNDQKQNPQNYKYKVIRCFSSCEKALLFEIKLHNKFNVARNPNFYNSAQQTTTKFSTQKLFAAISDTGEIIMVSKEDELFKSGKVKALSKGKCSGTVVVKDKDNNKFRVSVDDPRYISGELVHICTGVKHSDLSNKLKSEKLKNRVVSEETRKKQSEKLKNRVVSEETRKKQSEIRKKRITKEETRIKISNALKGTTLMKDKQGNIFRGRIDDPRFISGEWVGATKKGD